MKRITSLLTIFLLIICSVCVVAKDTDKNNEVSTIQNSDQEVNVSATENTKTLVVYFSCTGHTENVAKKIASELEADTFKIEPKNPYTQTDLNYNEDCRARREDQNPDARPEITNSVNNMDSYDIIFLGYPIWYGKAPKIMYTFLEKYDFTNKTIIPFCTSGSSGIGSSATNLHSLAPDAKWLDGNRFASTASDTAIKDWVDGLNIQQDSSQDSSYDGIFPEHKPYGQGIGAEPGRVVWEHDPNSVDWDGNGYWWETNHFDEPTILKMVNNSIASLGGKNTAKEGWNALFTARNSNTKGYTAGEKIAIKANINGSAVNGDDTTGKTNMSYTNPVLLKALLTSMVREAGIRPSDITVYDVSRLFPDYMVEMCTNGELDGINFVNRNNGKADENSPIIWSHEFSGAENYLPTCVTEAKYVINLANLKGHSYGITLCGKNHFGSFINGNKMRPPEGANLHQWLTRNEMGIYSSLVDLMANADLGGKTVLYMLDALICAPSEGASITANNSKWKQDPFNGDYTSSVLVSQDPVAIDSVGADLLTNEPTVTDNNSTLKNKPAVENYLHEAGLVSNPPSRTKYTDSKGHQVTNLGVHEHWNNSKDKKYSRNLGKSEGIELVYSKNSENNPTPDEPEKIAVTGVSVSPSSQSIEIGKTLQLQVNITPSNATNKEVTWSSSNTAVAEVSTTGLVTAKAVGTATVSVITKDGNYRADCQILVTETEKPDDPQPSQPDIPDPTPTPVIPPTPSVPSTPSVPNTPPVNTNVAVKSVSVSPTSQRLEVAQTVQLKATISPSNATNKALTWSTTNKNVAQVNTTGLVTAKAAGTATISVTTKDGNYKASCNITVVNSQKPENNTPQQPNTPTPNTPNTPTPNAPSQPTPDTPEQLEQIQIYRLYNPDNSEHLYTSDEHEKDVLVTSGWKDEGTGWISPATGDPVYRVYSDVAKEHLYTKDQNEVQALVASGAWTVDNSGNPLFYSGGSRPIYRLYNESLMRHHLTTDENEYNVLKDQGWKQEGVALNSL